MFFMTFSKSNWLKYSNWFRKRRLLFFFLSPALLYLAVVAYYPIAYAFRLSLFQGSTFVGLSNYIKAISREYFFSNLLHSFQWSFTIVIAQNLIGLAFAVLLSTKIKFRNVWRGLQYLPWLLPPTVVGVVWISFYLPVLGLVNTTLRSLGLVSLTRDWLGDPSTTLNAVILADIWHFYPFFSIMYLAGIAGIQETIYEAAKIDGANSWQRFFRITLPLIRPIMLTVSLVQFIWVFRFFDLIWIMTRGGPAKASEVLATQVYKTALYRSDFNEASALGIIMSGIMLMVLLVYLYIYRKGESNAPR